MSEGRKLAAILVSDLVGYSRMTGEDEERTLERLRGLRSEFVDPSVAAHDGRIVKGTGDGVIAEYRSVVEAARSAIEIQNGLAERNSGFTVDAPLVLRIGVHLGDVVEEPDGDLLGDGVNIAARLQSICEPGGVCLSEDAYRQVRDKLPEGFSDLGEKELRNIVRPVRVYGWAPTGVAVAPPPRFSASRRWHEWSFTFWRAPPPVRASPPPKPHESPKAAKQRPLTFGRLVGRGFLLIALISAASSAVKRALYEPPEPPVAASAVAPGEDKLARAAKLSMVVLPFVNMSDDPGQERLADALTDDLTTAMARIPGAFVISRSTAFAYKGMDINLQQLGRRLGVRYALEGSVRQSGETITFNVQLISTESWAYLWADRFEGERARLGDLEAEAVARIADLLKAR